MQTTLGPKGNWLAQLLMILVSLPPGIKAFTDIISFYCLSFWTKGIHVLSLNLCPVGGKKIFPFSTYRRTTREDLMGSNKDLHTFLKLLPCLVWSGYSVIQISYCVQPWVLCPALADRERAGRLQPNPHKVDFPQDIGAISQSRGRVLGWHNA